ncbi:MAG: hypothetical protein ACOCRX_01200 [Candidatus Woesearchaeota archaeon]
MNLKIVFIMFLSIFLISCVSEPDNNNLDEGFILNEGKGYEISFDYSSNLPHGQDNELLFEFKNTGTHDIENLNFDFKDNTFVKFSEKSITDSLNGRSLENPLPTTLRENFNFQTISRNDLGLKDINERVINLRWSSNFDYSTTDSLDICINLDDGEVCNFNSITSNKKGSPIVVSSVEWDIITYSDELKVFFDIYLDNLGEGIPYIKGNEIKQNYIKINSLKVAGKECSIQEDEVNLNLDQVIQCDISLDRDIDSRITLMTIDFDYNYKLSGSIPLEINYR